jgi:hypothetical protein
MGKIEDDSLDLNFHVWNIKYALIFQIETPFSLIIYSRINVFRSIMELLFYGQYKAFIR